ncbi:MAG: transglutaminase family protein [Spirochaetaceae bacterium]|nr:MAG: transglutaminase family protein [Spirochaetaceae bacterium]
MRFRIRHVTRYSFNRPIFLEPHTVRLTPRSDGSFHLVSHRLVVMPTPAGASVGLDAWGNTVHRLWFSGLTDTLRIDSESEGDALRANPFDYLVDEPVQALPPRYSPTELATLSACLAVDRSPAVERFADRIAGASASPPAGARSSAGPSTHEFLAAMTVALAAEHTSIVRPEGPPYDPETTLDTREVSCRDLAVLFIAACRVRGIAARFVSGYQAGDPGQTDRDLHAWVEAYLPGAGWRAYDPTLGLVVADQHVALAAAAHPEDAAPVTGNFRGTGARSGMESTIDLTVYP